ncbi:hypothetical protein HDU76_000300 [Blyttiomyces sp. JEL0837]|nr:hypothetical protein HDU76_000300 [Blyttiomyces sp. JEL0837]
MYRKRRMYDDANEADSMAEHSQWGSRQWPWTPALAEGPSWQLQSQSSPQSFPDVTTTPASSFTPRSSETYSNFLESASTAATRTSKKRGFSNEFSLEGGGDTIVELEEAAISSPESSLLPPTQKRIKLPRGYDLGTAASTLHTALESTTLKPQSMSVPLPTNTYDNYMSMSPPPLTPITISTSSNGYNTPSPTSDNVSMQGQIPTTKTLTNDESWKSVALIPVSPTCRWTPLDASQDNRTRISPVLTSPLAAMEAMMEMGVLPSHLAGQGIQVGISASNVPSRRLSLSVMGLGEARDFDDDEDDGGFGAVIGRRRQSAGATVNVGGLPPWGLPSGIHAGQASGGKVVLWRGSGGSGSPRGGISRWSPVKGFPGEAVGEQEDSEEERVVVDAGDRIVELVDGEEGPATNGGGERKDEDVDMMEMD